MAALKLEPLLENGYRIHIAIPTPDQARAGLQLPNSRKLQFALRAELRCKPVQFAHSRR